MLGPGPRHLEVPVCVPGANLQTVIETLKKLKNIFLHIISWSVGNVWVSEVRVLVVGRTVSESFEDPDEPPTSLENEPELVCSGGESTTTLKCRRN